MLLQNCHDGPSGTLCRRVMVVIILFYILSYSMSAFFLRHIMAFPFINEKPYGRRIHGHPVSAGYFPNGW
jgi:hypothetical protein